MNPDENNSNPPQMPESEPPVNNPETPDFAAPAPEAFDSSSVESEPVTEPVAGPVVSGQTISSTKPGKKNSKPTMILGIILAVILLGIGSAFAVQHFFAENGDDESSEQVINDADAEEEPAVVEEPAADPTNLNIDKTIRDEDLGYTINATRLITDPFAIPERYSAAQQGKVVVLVEMTISTDGTYAGSPSTSSLRIIDAAGNEATSVVILEDEMRAAGYEPLPTGSAKVDEPLSGFVAFMVDGGQEGDMTLRHKRLASTVIGGGGSIPAKDFDVKLTD